MKRLLRLLGDAQLRAALPFPKPEILQSDWLIRPNAIIFQVPAGSLPRTADVILRHDIVESARAGDKVVFTGNVIVIPDVAAITTPGERVEASMSKYWQIPSQHNLECMPLQTSKQTVDVFLANPCLLCSIVKVPFV